MSDKAKFTPGPWRGHCTTIRDPAYWVTAEGGVPSPYGRGCIASVEGNGYYDTKLIAAAPDLYEALLMFETRLREVFGAHLDQPAIVIPNHPEDGESAKNAEKILDWFIGAFGRDIIESATLALKKARGDA